MPFTFYSGTSAQFFLQLGTKHESVRAVAKHTVAGAGGTLLRGVAILVGLYKQELTNKKMGVPSQLLCLCVIDIEVQ